MSIILKRWLEPIIIKRIDEVAILIDTDQLFREIERQYKKTFAALENAIPEEHKQNIYTIDSQRNDLIRVCIELSYKFGFNDGVEIHKGADTLRI